MTKTLPKLSFKKSVPNFWHVQPTGDDWEDEKLGYRLALEYLAHEEATAGGAGYLHLIVGDMPRELGAMEIAFLSLVSYAVAAGADKARQVAARWKSREAEVDKVVRGKA